MEGAPPPQPAAEQTAGLEPRQLLGEAELALTTLGRTVDHLTKCLHHPTPPDPRDTLLPNFLPFSPPEAEEHDRRLAFLRALYSIRGQITELAGRITVTTQTATSFGPWADGVLFPAAGDARRVVGAGLRLPVPDLVPVVPPPDRLISERNHGRAPPIEQLAGRTDVARPVYVEVADGLEVEAMLLPESCKTPAEVLENIRGPMLCYVPAWKHFAVRLGSKLLHGNVGQIYPVGTPHPVGVKTCARCPPDRPDLDCTYYHDPAGEKGEGAVGVRNYLADAFCYTSRFETPRRAARYGRRHFGSHDSLRLDMQAMSDAEVQSFLDQVGHDLVCAALLLHNRPQ